MAVRNPVKRISTLPRIGPRLTVALLAAVAALGATPAIAPASFHEILVREVYAGGASNDSYVVLQAYNGGQNLVGGHKIVAYGPEAGAELGSFEFTSSVSNSANQMTILVADSAYSTGFPSGPVPDGSLSTMNLSPAGGAVCWNGTPDCVSWGNFSGSTPSVSGTPVLPDGIPGGNAIRRKITAGCATLLEPFPTDDSNNSSADFEAVTPTPRSNASTIVEANCVAPQTTVNTGPQKPTNVTSASFTYSASPASGATFECKLDGGSFEDCTPSPKSYAGPLDGDDLANGTSHKFEVKATNATGTDPSPAVWEWKVDTVKPTATINGQPPDPSPGASAAFNFSANETATFECQLSGPTPFALAACVSGKTYTSLAEGEYTFSVQAKDSAGNTGDPDTYEWTVDEEALDTTPPQTTITVKPPDPSASASASFAYESNEPSASFECSLDGGPFAGCPLAGIFYGGLANGPHSFQVRARDIAGNVDKSPAGHSWTVAAPIPSPPPPILTRPPVPVPPQTTITAKPPARSRDRTPTLRFRADQPGATYQCKVDAKPYKACRSPFTTKLLSFGRHTVKVRAVAGGLADSTPAQTSFKVVRGRR
jgi:hypothetical protein